MWRLAFLFLVTACGPAGSGDADASSSSTGETPASSSGTPDPSTSGTAPDSTGTAPSSTGPSTNDTGDQASSSSSDDGGFITDPPTGGICGGKNGGLAVECSVRDQDCCDGEACKAWANDGTDVWNASRCTSIAPNAGQKGEACTAVGSAVTGDDTCDLGLMCWNVDSETLEGTCAQFCGVDDGDPTCATPSEVCSIFNYGSLPLCLPACDPLDPDCTDGFGCYPTSQEDFACVREGDRILSDGVFHPECPSGTFAVAPEFFEECVDDAPCCASFCDQTAQSPCAGGECLPYFEPPMDTLPVGYCSIPV